ncbi:hypothetical protein J8273_0458 [Carpediemonas membranifera]|uniref:Uncharacterized protein n=1 Tax=Carpediemonas membranifera TaxID=201153 RepID=A0A8J6B406_9EUKA|nr:hypothetical protein J8273_0458 [Carpediemonas membranifera]|eukprot:KAG9395238.1 hypothetical protein J8273_0458 [Carpediemonas membranifera]
MLLYAALLALLGSLAFCAPTDTPVCTSLDSSLNALAVSLSENQTVLACPIDSNTTHIEVFSRNGSDWRLVETAILPSVETMENADGVAHIHCTNTSTVFSYTLDGWIGAVPAALGLPDIPSVSEEVEDIIYRGAILATSVLLLLLMTCFCLCVCMATVLFGKLTFVVIWKTLDILVSWHVYILTILGWGAEKVGLAALFLGKTGLWGVISMCAFIAHIDVALLFGAQYAFKIICWPYFLPRFLVRRARRRRRERESTWPRHPDTGEPVHPKKMRRLAEQQERVSRHRQAEDLEAQHPGPQPADPAPAPVMDMGMELEDVSPAYPRHPMLLEGPVVEQVEAVDLGRDRTASMQLERAVTPIVMEPEEEDGMEMVRRLKTPQQSPRAKPLSPAPPSSEATVRSQSRRNRARPRHLRTGSGDELTPAMSASSDFGTGGVASPFTPTARDVYTGPRAPATPRGGDNMATPSMLNIPPLDTPTSLRASNGRVFQSPTLPPVGNSRRYW